MGTRRRDRALRGLLGLRRNAVHVAIKRAWRNHRRSSLGHRQRLVRRHQRQDQPDAIQRVFQKARGQDARLPIGRQHGVARGRRIGLGIIDMGGRRPIPRQRKGGPCLAKPDKTDFLLHGKGHAGLYPARPIISGGVS